VDQPPLIAGVARFAWWLSGHGQSVLLFRLPVYLAHGAAVWVAASLARTLGGGRFAARLTALAVALAPIQLAMFHLVTMNAFELLFWVAIAWAVAVALRGEPRAWLCAGALLGLSLLTKYSAGFLAVALVLGLLLTPARAQLKRGWLWAGVGIAAGLALPTLLWQLGHHLPFLELLRNGQADKNAVIPPGAFAVEVVMEQGPLGSVLALLGLGWLLISTRSRPFRALGLTVTVLLGAMLALHPKPYYLAPAITPLFAAGAVAFEAWARPAWARGLALALLPLSALPALPLTIPILPLDGMLAWQAKLGVKPARLEKLRYTDVPQVFADQFGWRERVSAVEDVVRGLSPEQRKDLILYTTNYGRAAALQLFGHGLPPVVSGHNQYYLWGVPGTPQRVLALGGELQDYQKDFGRVALLGHTPELPRGMPYESSIPIYLLESPRAPIRELFKGAKNFR
jgi:4-amino-4-deoxy-L-arabinose transferase-like glycosyltransferase